MTEEQANRGEVLPICLEEIHRCRPYFIGILGERYGWVPDKIPEELIAQEPWLAEHLHHLVTELEILHGVLNNPAMARRAYFYFRDPAYLDTIPLERRPRTWAGCRTIFPLAFGLSSPLCRGGPSQRSGNGAGPP